MQSCNRARNGTNGIATDLLRAPFVDIVDSMFKRDEFNKKLQLADVHDFRAARQQQPLSTVERLTVVMSIAEYLTESRNLVVTSLVPEMATENIRNDGIRFVSTLNSGSCRSAEASHARNLYPGWHPVAWTPCWTSLLAPRITNHIFLL